MKQRLLHVESAGGLVPEQVDRSILDRPGNPKIYCNPRTFADRSVADFDAGDLGKPRGRLFNLLRYLGIVKPFISRQND